MGALTAGGARHRARGAARRSRSGGEGFLDLVAARARAHGRPARVHVKHDSGMGRLGTRDPDEVLALLRACAESARPRAGRGLDPLRHRRRTRLGLLRRAARPLRARSPRRPRAEFPGVVVHAANSAARLPRPALPLRHGPLRRRRLRPRPLPGRPGRARPARRRSRCTPTSPTSSASRPASSAGYGRTWRRRARDLRRRAAARLRRRRPARPLQQRRGAGRRPPPPAGRHRLDGQRDDRPRPRDRGRAGRRGGADRLPGRGGDPRRGGRAAARHDQLRDHLRDLRPGPAGRGRAEPRRAPRRRAARRPRRARRWRAARTPGSSAAPSATRRWAARSTDLDLAVAGDPAAAAKAIARAGDGHAFELSAEFATWRAVGRDGAWQVDVDRAARRDDRGRPGGARLHARRGRRAARRGRADRPLRRPRRPRPAPPARGRRRAASPTTRCACCARPGSPPSSTSRSIPTRSRSPAPRRPAAAEPAGERQLAELRQLIGGARPAARPRAARRARPDGGRPARAGGPARGRAGPQPPPRRPRPHARRAGADARGRGRPRALRRRARRRGRASCSPSRSPTR